MSKPIGIEAAAHEIKDIIFVGVSGGDDKPFLSKLTGIIAKHCVDDYLFQTQQRLAQEYAAEVSALTKKLRQCENSLTYSRKLNDEFCRIAHQFEEPISKNEACE